MTTRYDDELCSLLSSSAVRMVQAYLPLLRHL
jgi:hypothetical protein